MFAVFVVLYDELQITCYVRLVKIFINYFGILKLKCIFVLKLWLHYTTKVSVKNYKILKIWSLKEMDI